MRAYSLPIYYGNPDVTRDFNPKAFVNVADYDFDLDKVVERIIYLDTHDDEYLAMLREKPLQDDFRYFDKNKFKEWIFHIIEKGRKPFNKDPRGLIEDKKTMADTSIGYRSLQGIKDTSLVGQLRDIIQATHVFVEKDEVRYLRKKYRFRLLRYRLFKHITFGAMKKKYTEKYKKLKNRIKSGV